MGKILKHSIIENVPFWILSGIAVTLGIIAFFIPPKAEIHPSVLKFISWIFAFTALWTVFVAMVRGIDARITHGKTSLAIGDTDPGAPQPPHRDEPIEEEVENE